MNELTIDELRFLQDALRNGVFNHRNCGWARKAAMAKEIEDALDDGDANDEGIDVNNMLWKIHDMDRRDLDVLVDKLNRCYFAEDTLFPELAEFETHEKV